MDSINQNHLACAIKNVMEEFEKLSGAMSPAQRAKFVAQHLDVWPGTFVLCSWFVLSSTSSNTYVQL